MKFNFDVISFVIGTIFGSGSIWKFFSYRLEKSKLQLKQVELSNELRKQQFELMSSLKDKRELFSDIRDGKKEIDGIRHNILNQLETEIDLIYDNIVEKEKQLAKIENRDHKKISKNHGGRPAAPGAISVTKV